MAKLTLTDLTQLTTNESSAISVINANHALIETAMENTMSRDGTTPNSMSADLDMNSNQIINLPAATTSTEPVRKSEFDANNVTLEATVSSYANAASVSANEAETDRLLTLGYRNEAEVFRDECEVFALALGGSVSATEELIQDTMGTALTDSTTIDFTYDDGLGTITATRAALTGDVSAPSNSNTTTLATVNANVGSFGSATDAPAFTVNGKGLITAASTNTITPAVGSITGLGAGVATFLATPSSANLRTAVTDESGSGALLFASGALGTPASGTLTNCTGLPTAGLVDDAVTYAKIQNVSLASKLLGRGDSGSGDPQEITLGTNLSMSGTTLNVTGGSGDVTAAATFTDNRLIRADGSVKGVQDSAITVADTTGDLSRTGGIDIEGTNTNDSAAAGYIGEYVSSTIASGSAVSLTTATAANITSISLTAGDWDVDATGYFSISVGADDLRIAINTTSGTLPSFGNGTGGYNIHTGGSGSLSTSVIPTAPIRMSLNATTTVYMVGFATFGSGTVSGFGTLRARRVR